MQIRIIQIYKTFNKHFLQNSNESKKKFHSGNVSGIRFYLTELGTFCTYYSDYPQTGLSTFSRRD